MEDFRVVIPVRYAASRLPGKPLLEFNGKTIMQHVYNNACASEARSVLIATDDARIAEVASSFGAKVCMTSNHHQSGTDRIAEATQLQGWNSDEVIVNLQGDEPQMPAQNIAQIAKLLIDTQTCSIATLCTRVDSEQEYQDPNAVKVVKSTDGKALYFSRAAIPHSNNISLNDIEVYRHIGIYAYRVGYLQQFVQMPQSSLEKLERLEQLRALEAGDSIAIAECVQKPGIGVDTEEDYQKLKVGESK